MILQSLTLKCLKCPFLSVWVHEPPHITQRSILDFLEGDWLLSAGPALFWTAGVSLSQRRSSVLRLSSIRMCSLSARLLLLVLLAVPLYGVEKVRHRGYRKDPDADKVRDQICGENFSVERSSYFNEKKKKPCPICTQ